MIRALYDLIAERVLRLLDKPCCKNPQIAPRTWTNGITEDFCDSCGLYQRSPLRKNAHGQWR